MKRVVYSQQVREFSRLINDQRLQIDKFSNQLSSGLEVTSPGDSSISGTISKFQSNLARINEYKKRVDDLQGSLGFQDGLLDQANNIMIRAKEIATQGASSLNIQQRSLLAEEVASLRDDLVNNFANAKYKGSYVYGGLDSDDPPFDAGTYTVPASGPFSQRYFYDGEDGTNLSKTVRVTDNSTVTVNTPGDQVFSDAIAALEILGRSLLGYSTTTSGGIPTGAGAAYATVDAQTQDIQASIDLIENARQSGIMVERVRNAGKLSTIESASNLLESLDLNSNEVLTKLQAVDVYSKAGELTQVQQLLEASLAVSSKILNAPTLLQFL